MKIPALIMFLALAATACGSKTPGEGAPKSEAPGFRQIHEALFAETCSSAACHGGAQGIAGLNFADADEAYSLLVNIDPTNGPARDAGLKRVVPNDPDASLLLAKLKLPQSELTEKGFGARMPVSLSRELGADGLAVIEAWIKDGAPLDGAAVDVDWVETESSLYVECDTTDEQGMRGCFAPPRSPDSRRLYSPPIVVPPHSEIIYCSYLDENIAEEILISATRGQQMAGGHHSAVFMANVPSEDFDPRDCDDLDMTNFRFLAGAGGGGGQDTDMPAGTALRLPQGSQIVLQSHYINVTAEPLTVMDAVDIEFAPDPDPIIADAFAMIYGDFEVLPGEQKTEIKNCALDQDMDIYMLLGHTHDYGVLFTMEHVKADGSTVELYHATDGPLLRDNPEIKMYDPPLTIPAGDSLRMTCTWDNTGRTPLTWPEEMCVSLMYYAPGRGWLTCDGNDETPQGGDDVVGCVPRDAVGNDVGVGKYCEVPADCQGSGAPACLAPFDPSANFCSIMQCATDADCGAEATCVSQSLGSACVPNECLD